MNLTRKLGSRIFSEVLLKHQKCLTLNFSIPHFRGKNDDNIMTNGPLVRNVNNAVSIQLKKRPVKKKKTLGNNLGFQVVAFSTAEEYNLEGLAKELFSQTTFKLREFSSDCSNLIDVLHAVDNSDKPDSESQELFIFREGSVVFWNLSDAEMNSILQLLKQYEESSYPDDLVKSEKEIMNYSYSPDIEKTGIVSDSVIFSSNEDLDLEKYTVSNAMAFSVHLGTFEANLQKYIDSMEPVTEDLKSGGIVKMSRQEVLQKAGQLFALRHNINLRSDLLDTPDFYWDREQLERLYQTTSNYFCISKRTRVINEKINHCIDLVQLLSSHLNDNHHIRLEWMIIILIMVEVGFEVLHFIGS